MFYRLQSQPACIRPKITAALNNSSSPSVTQPLGMDPTDRIRRELLRALQTDDTDKLKKILKTLKPQEGVLASPMDQSGNHVLAVAVLNAFEEGVELLLDHGVNANAGNCWMETALHIAVEQNLNTIVDALLANDGCDIDIQTKNRGETPLHIASRVGNKFAVKELLDCDCDKSLVDFDRNTALHLAVKNKRRVRVREKLALGSAPCRKALLSGGDQMDRKLKKLQFVQDYM